MYMYHVEHSLCNLNCAHVKVHFATRHAETPSRAAQGSGGRGLWTVISSHRPQLRRRKASEARGYAFILLRSVVECGRFPVSVRALVTDHPSPLRSNFVSTLLLINSTFYEQAVYWSTQLSIAQILTWVRIPLLLWGQYPRYVPSGMQQYEKFFILCLTASSNHTYNNPTRMQNQRLPVQF